MFKAVVERPKGVGRDEDEDYGGISAFKALNISGTIRICTKTVRKPKKSPAAWLVWPWPSPLAARAILM